MKDANRQLLNLALIEARSALELYTYSGLHNDSSEEEWKEADEKAKKAVDLCRKALQQIHSDRLRKRKGTVAANPGFYQAWETTQNAMAMLLRQAHNYGATDLFYIWVDEVLARVQDISRLEPMTPDEVEVLYREQAAADTATAAAEGIGATR